jgi:hypothetical protein
LYATPRATTAAIHGHELLPGLLGSVSPATVERALVTQDVVGRTPLDLALQAKRHANADILKAMTSNVVARNTLAGSPLALAP